MSTAICTLGGERELQLVQYLYGEGDAAVRTAFEAHLARCQVCRDEVEALGATRRELGRWHPPEPAWRVGAVEPPTAARSWWHEVPAWAQAAAAVLAIGVALGAANLRVTYGGAGVTVQTGWLVPKAESAAVPVVVATAAPWRADLDSLASSLRADMQAAAAAAVRQTAAPAPAQLDPAAVRQVRALVAESERQQQRELALRVAEIARDVQGQRQADLAKIDHTLGVLQNNTGVEVMRQRQLLNSLAVRVSQRQP